MDEAGDTRSLWQPTYNIARVCVVLGVAFEQAALKNLTEEFLDLKYQRFPGLMRRGPWSRRVLAEIKGADLRKTLRTGAGRRHRRHTLGFLDKLIKLLEDYDARIFGRVWIKKVGKSINERALYTSSVQAICVYFQSLLVETGDEGFVIADHRTPALNTNVSFSVFTQKFKQAGDAHERILEMPTFGDSRVHAGIQIADLVSSALLFPMATAAYCVGHVQSVHVDPSFKVLAQRFGSRLQALQYRYERPDGRRAGGITVDDRLCRRPGGLIFRP